MLRKYLLCVVSALFLLVSCDKFEDGGMKSASRRNIVGTWGYERVVRNDAELTDSVFAERYAHSYVIFERGSIAHLSWYDAAQILQEEQTATYVFTYNKKKLCLVFDSYPLQEWQWHVKRLTEDQLWVEYAENDTLNYRIEFIKLKK